MERIENWVDVPGYPGYRVSDMGRVRSVTRMVRSKHGTEYSRPGQMLSVSGKPYAHVTLFRDGIRNYVDVHVLVLEAFAGPRPDGTIARHGPGGLIDNRYPENLCWGTQSDNLTVDRNRDGTSVKGEDIASAVLTAEIVRACRARYANGDSFQRMAAEYGVDRTVMWRAVTSRTWRHA